MSLTESNIEIIPRLDTVPSSGLFLDRMSLVLVRSGMCVMMFVLSLFYLTWFHYSSFLNILVDDDLTTYT